MDKKQMTIIGIVAAVVILYFILKQKGTTTAANQTARSASLAQPLTGLIGTGVTLLSNFVKAGMDYFSGNTQLAAQVTKSTDIGTMFSPSDLEALSNTAGYWDSWDLLNTPTALVTSTNPFAEL